MEGNFKYKNKDRKNIWSVAFGILLNPLINSNSTQDKQKSEEGKAGINKGAVSSLWAVSHLPFL